MHHNSECRLKIEMRNIISLFKTRVRSFKNNSYPLCHLLFQKRLDNSKDAFENPGLVNYVNGFDSDWKPIL